MKEIFNQRMLDACIRLGIRPTHAFTHVSCRLTGWSGWLPFNARTLTKRNGVFYANQGHAKRVLSNPVTMHPCKVADFMWHMKELNSLLDAGVEGGRVTADSTACYSTEEAGRLLVDWLCFDKPLNSDHIRRLQATRRAFVSMDGVLRWMRPYLWEHYKAFHLAISPMPGTAELYVDVVDDTPWILPLYKPSKLDKESS